MGGENYRSRGLTHLRCAYKEAEILNCDVMLQSSPKTEAELVSTRDNPAPQGATVDHTMTADGAKLRHAYWKPIQGSRKGTIIILQGRSEFIEKYFETVEDLRKLGFGVLTFDWRGQGGSSRLLRDPSKGHVENFNQYLVDLETILTDVALPDCKPPFFILGHSTGSLVALLAGPALTNRVQRMVLSSPLLELTGIPIRQSWLKPISGLFTLVGLGRLSVGRKKKWAPSRPFAGNKLTSDEKRFTRNKGVLHERPGLGIGPPTVSWLFAACRTMAQVCQPGYSSAILIPTLLVVAGSDKVVSPSAVEVFGRKMRSGSFQTISGSKHEILQERDVFRQQMLAVIEAFIPGQQS